MLFGTSIIVYFGDNKILEENEQIVNKYEPRTTPNVFKSIINDYKAEQ